MLKKRISDSNTSSKDKYKVNKTAVYNKKKIY